jgi:hypothetical protein
LIAAPELHPNPFSTITKPHQLHTDGQFDFDANPWPQLPKQNKYTGNFDYIQSPELSFLKLHHSKVNGKGSALAQRFTRQDLTSDPENPKIRLAPNRARYS